jgi:hypothetical protein
MDAPSGKGKIGWWQGFFAGLTLIAVIGGYGAWQFAYRYRIESEVLAGYKNGNRELMVVLSKELENEPGPRGVADDISRTLADRLQQRGYSVQLVKAETVKGRSSREKAERPTASTSNAYDSSTTPLTSQALARAAQAGEGILRVSLSEVRFTRSNDVVSETYVLELLNPDRSPAWKATLTYRSTGFEVLYDLYRLGSGDPVVWRGEALADLTIERMLQQGVLK